MWDTSDAQMIISYITILMDCSECKSIEMVAYMMAYQPERERQITQHAL